MSRTTSVAKQTRGTGFKMAVLFLVLAEITNEPKGGRLFVLNEDRIFREVRICVLQCSLVGVVLFGTVAGSMLPFVLRALGVDPAGASAPFVATLVDVTGLI